MSTDTSKITDAANQLGDGLAKGGTAAKTLGQEIVNVLVSVDSRLTALESAELPPKPIEPPSGGPAGGLITAHSAALYGTTTVDGKNYSAHVVTRPHAYQQIDDYTLRYEIRQGDTPPGDNGIDRSEVQSYDNFRADTAVTIAYRIMVEPGPANGADWMVCGVEWHNDDTQSPTYTSPMFVTEAVGDKFSIVIRYPGANGDISPAGCTLQRLWTQPDNFVRGQWYVFEIEAKPNKTSGYFRCKLDGQSITDYTGPLGYGFDGYAMFGLYRNSRPESFAVKIKNMTVSWAS